MAEVSSDLVKKGLWINWSKGYVLGATITTDQGAANAVIALIAILVSLSTGGLWDLLMFCYYQLRAHRSRSLEDGLFRQQQVLFRTLPDSATIVSHNIQLYYNWRQRADRAFWRCFIPVIFATTFGLAAVVSGVFTSYLVSTIDLPVLVKDTDCAYLNWTAINTLAPDPWQTRLESSTQTFASHCYTNGTLPSECQIYVQPRVPFTNRVDECHLSASMCAGNSIVLDTELLDSQRDLGINAPVEHRVQIRKRTQCSPVSVKPFWEFVNASQAGVVNVWRPLLPDEEYSVFKFGRTLGNWQNNGSIPNVTFSLSTANGNSTQTYTSTVTVNYWSPEMAPHSTFQPIDGLKVEKEADMTLTLIGTNLTLVGAPVNDPVYAAHRRWSMPCAECPGGESVWYYADLPAGAVACTHQYQYCVTTSPGQLQCTELAGMRNGVFRELLPAANDLQIATLDLVSTSLVLQDYNSLGHVKPAVLNSNTYTTGAVVPSLPDDQWTRDVHLWEAWMWSAALRAITDRVTGLPSDEPHEKYYRPTSAAQRTLCQNQIMVKPGGFANINAFGLAFTVVISCLVLLADRLILHFIIFTEKVRRLLATGVEMWIQDGVFQLQSEIYQSRKEGWWTNFDSEVPVTEAGDMLTALYR